MIRKEWRRVFGTRTTLLVLLLFLIVQGVLLIYSEEQKRSYSTKAYERAWNEVKALLKVEEPGAVQERLNRHIEKLRFLEYFSEYDLSEFLMRVGTLLGEDVEADFYASLQKEFPTVDMSTLIRQHRLGRVLRHTEQPAAERQLYQDVATELFAVASYPEYRATVAADAERMLRFSVFAKPGTFAYRNIEATLEQYQNLPEVAVTPVPAKAAATLFQGSVPGILLLFFLLYLCIPLYLSEKEEGTIRITRTCVKGRKPLGRVKLVVLLAGAFLMQFLVYGLRFLILEEMYGFPELSLSIQSVSGFQGCVLPLTIGQYFLFTFLLRYAVLCLCGVCMAMFCSLCTTTKKAYAGIFVFFLVQVLLYYAVSANASYGALHFLNFWGMFRFDAIGSYLNLNLFGSPVSCLFAVTALLAVGLPVSAVVAVRAFCRKPANRSRKEKKMRRCIGLPQTTSVFLHEGRKLFFDQRVLLVLLAVLVVQGVRYQGADMSESMEEYYYRYYMELLEGKLTPEKEAFLESEVLRFQALHEKAGTSLYAQNALNAEPGFLKAYRQYGYLKGTAGGQVFYDAGYRYLLAEDTYETDLLLMVTSVVLFVLTGAGVFCGDTENGMLSLLTTTRDGKKGIIARLVWGGVLAVVIWLLVYTPDLVCTLKQYGTQGLSAPAQSIAILAEVDQLLLKEYLILVYLWRLLGLFAVSAAMYLFAYFTKSTAITVFGTLAIGTVPAFLVLLSEKMIGILLPYAPFSGNLLRRYPGGVGGCLVILYVAFVFFSYKFMVKRRKFSLFLFTNHRK